MTITQRLMKPGRFHIELTDNYPDRIASAIGLFDHVVITPTPVDVDALGDAAILSQSIYTGVITAKPSLRIFEGADLSWWLGTDQGLGDILNTAVSLVANTLTQWITALLPASLTLGTITNTSTLTNSYQWITRREAIDAVCRAVSAEWRVNPNGTLDAAAKAVLFATPSPSSGIVVTRKAEGVDGALRGLDASLLVPGSDVEQFTTTVYALGQGTGPAVLNSVALMDVANPYKDLLNGVVVMERIVSAPSDPSAVTGNIASAVLGQFHFARREITLASDTYTVTRFIHPGDEVYVYDLRAGLTDPANQIDWRGELIAPIKQRVLALTWPLERGCGVYLRKSGATPTYIDLTPYIAWEDGDVQWEIGAGSRLAIGSGENLGTAYLPTTAEVADRVAPGARIGGEWARVAVTSVAASTLFTIAWDTEVTDSHNFLVPTSGSATIPTDLGGTYAITSTVLFATVPTGVAFMRIIAGGNTYDFAAATNVAGLVSATIVVPLVATNTIVVQVWQTSAGAINATGKLFLTRIGP